MDDESKKMHNELLELTRENNQILRKMRRSQQVASVMRAIYWIIIIGVSVGAFYLLQPYVEQLQGIYGGASDAFKNFQNIGQ